MSSKVSRRAFLQAGALALTAGVISACGGTSQPVPTEAPKVVEKVVEKIVTATPEPTKPPTATPSALQRGGTVRAALLAAPARADTFKKISDAFMAKYPNIKAEWIPVQAAEWEEYYGKLVTLIAAGESVDAAEISTEGLQVIASKGVLRPLDDYVKAEAKEMAELFSDIAAQFTEIAMYKGNLYYLPFLWGAAHIIYNVNLFKQADVEPPKDDWTIQDMVAAARKIRALGSDVYGLGFPNRHWGGLLLWMYINNGDLYEYNKFPGGGWMWSTFYADDPNAKGRDGGIDWGNPTANREENVQALQFLQDLIWKEKVSPLPTDIGQLVNFCANNKLGMFVGHRAHCGALFRAGMKKGDFDVAYVPKWQSQSHQFGCSGLGIMKVSKVPELAWQLIKFELSKEQQYNYVDQAVHTATRRSVANDPKQHEVTGPEHWYRFYGALDNFPTSRSIAAPLEAKDMANIFVKYVGLALANEMPAKEAMDKVQNDLVELKKRARP